MVDKTIPLVPVVALNCVGSIEKKIRIFVHEVVLVRPHLPVANYSRSSDCIYQVRGIVLSTNNSFTTMAYKFVFSGATRVVENRFRDGTPCMQFRYTHVSGANGSHTGVLAGVIVSIRRE